MQSQRTPHLLIVGGGREIPGLARKAIPELRTTVFCRAEVLPRVREIPINERVFVFRDSAPADEWVAAARTLHDLDRFDRIATYSEKDQDKAAEIGRALGLPTHRPETVHWVHDKVAMRERLVECGVDDTTAVRVRSLEEAREAIARLGLPVICKPARGVASSGVSRIDRIEDLPAALAFLEREAAGLDSADALLETLHTGQEFSVECFSENGEHLVACITQKYSEPGHFVEVGHVLPALLADSERALVEKTVVTALDALKIADGVTHTEVILTDTGVRLIETHLRPAGDEIPYLLAEARGIDLVDALARQSVGMVMMPAVRSAVAAAEARSTCAAIWYALPPTQGALVEVRGVEDANTQPGVTEVEVLCQVGATVGGQIGSSARLAHVRATGDSPTEAVERARSAARLLSYVLEVGGQAE